MVAMKSPCRINNCNPTTILTALLVVIASFNVSGVAISDIFETISRKPELKQFFTQLQNYQDLASRLRNSQMTVFAFTDEAYGRYTGMGKNTRELIMYHMTELLAPTKQFPVPLGSILSSNPPIWATRVMAPGSQAGMDYYVNNARLTQMDIMAKSSGGYDQMLHIIDEVLEPLLVRAQGISALNPSAYRLMSDPDIYGISDNLMSFKSRVDNMRRDMIFSGGDGNTFFIVHNGGNSLETWNRVDETVLDAHVIKDGVMFARSFPKDPQQTLAFAHNAKVTVSILNETTDAGRGFTLYAQSNNIMSSGSYPRGVVVSRIMRANIPVKNGVVHIIDKPLVIIDKSLRQFVEETETLSEFFKMLQVNGQDVLDLLTVEGKTLFAPNNEAVRSVEVQRLALINNDRTKLNAMLRLHVVPQYVTTDAIVGGLVYSALSSDGKRSLRFSHPSNSNRLARKRNGVTVTGGGVNASIIQADIAATTGVVHIIDKVLGIPYQSVFDILKMEKSFSTTLQLGEQEMFNTQLTNEAKKYTYFVPTDTAWMKVSRQMPDVFARITSTADSYYVAKILQRHLVVNHAYSLDDLIKLHTIRTVNSDLYIKTLNGRIVVQWLDITAEIVVSDIDAANGYVHAIGTAFVKSSDLSTSGSAMSITSIMTMLLPMLVVKLLV